MFLEAVGDTAAVEAVLQLTHTVVMKGARLIGSVMGPRR